MRVYNNDRKNLFFIMKWSNILLIVGMLVLVVGAVLSIMDIRPYSDYVLVAGAIIVIFRGAVKNRENN
jgi:hypothetical protein